MDERSGFNNAPLAQVDTPAVAPGLLPPAFTGVVFAALAALIVGLALPLVSVDGQAQKGALAESPSDVVPLLLVLGAPMVVGALRGRSNRLLAGIAGGACIYLAIAVPFVWVVAFVIIKQTNDLAEAFGSGSDVSIGAGAIVLLICSVLALIASIMSIKVRTRSATVGVVAKLGAAAAVLTVIGAMIPQGGQSVGSWLGFDAHPLLGVAALYFIAGLLFMSLCGFLGDVAGLGLVLGFLGVMAVGNLVADDDNALGAFFVGGTAEWHPITLVGWYSMLGLLVVHTIQMLGGAAARSQQSRAAASPAQWAADPFGRHQLRYYDGKRWTDHVSTAGVQAVDPATAAPLAPPIAASPMRSTPPTASLAAPLAPPPSAVGWTPPPAPSDASASPLPDPTGAAASPLPAPTGPIDESSGWAAPASVIPAATVAPLPDGAPPPPGAPTANTASGSTKTLLVIGAVAAVVAGVWWFAIRKGESSRSELCDAYRKADAEWNSEEYFDDDFFAAAEDLADVAKRYESNSLIQQEGRDLDRLVDIGEVSGPEWFSATDSMFYECNPVIGE